MEDENPYSRRTNLVNRAVEVYEIKTGKVVSRFNWTGGRPEKLKAKEQAMELVARSWVSVCGN